MNHVKLTLNQNWWSSESGSPISGLALVPAAGKDYRTNKVHKPLPIKPGSAGKPTPGFDVRVVNDVGDEVGKGAMGNIVLALPLAPTAFTTLWRDEERFYNNYLKRFDGRWLDTGDAGMIDENGYIHVMYMSHFSHSPNSSLPMSQRRIRQVMVTIESTVC